MKKFFISARPKQILKNFVIFIPLIFTLDQWSINELSSILTNSFLCFLALSSASIIGYQANDLIDKKFVYVLIVLQSKKFFSPMSAGKINDYTYVDTLEKLNYPNSKIQKRNLTGGFNGFDWKDKKSRFIAKMWKDLSNQEDLILPKNSTKDNHRWDQSLLTVLIYKYNYFGYIPKIKKNVSFRRSAFMVAIDRVAKAELLRGL